MISPYSSWVSALGGQRTLGRTEISVLSCPLMTPEEFEAVMRKLVHIEPDGPLHDFRVAFPKPNKN